MAGETTLTGKKLEKKTFEQPDEVRTFKNGEVRLVNLTEGTIGKFHLEPGWKWSESVKPVVGTESCQQAHVAYILKGRLHIRLDDGTETDYGPGDAQFVPPGHNAWVVGSEPVEMLDFKGAATYLKK